MNEYICDFIDKWNRVGAQKNKNDTEFIKYFYDYALNSDYELWAFSGENGYCGYTAILSEYGPWIPIIGYNFEFAYGKDFVKVFTAFHDGFWVPEYIDLSGPEAGPLLHVIKSKLITWSGFNN